MSACRDTSDRLAGNIPTSARCGGSPRPREPGARHKICHPALKSGAPIADSAYMSAGVGPVPALDRSSP